MKLFASALLATCAVAIPSEKAYEGKKLVRIKTLDIDTLHEVTDKFGLDVWSVDRTTHSMDVIYDDHLSGFEHEVVLPDVQAHFDELFADPTFLCESGTMDCVGEVNVTKSIERGQKRDPYYDRYPPPLLLFLVSPPLPPSPLSPVIPPSFLYRRKTRVFSPVFLFVYTTHSRVCI
jgi:hypothetical protein